MEFIAGAIVTLFCFVASNVLINRYQLRPSLRVMVNNSQSRKFAVLSPFVQYTVSSLKPDLKTQATDYHDKTALRVLLYEDRAYWIQSNALYSANFADGKVDDNTKQRVDTMTLDEVELKKVSYIVDRLTDKVSDEDFDSRQ